jgi:SAM-dependent methyltransferase
MTAPPEGRPHRASAGNETYQERQVAESFGSDAERYDRARPRYPAAMVAAIVAASPGPSVLDVGCGTGIVARQLEAAGCRVLGVDPDARMVALAQRFGVEGEVAKFEDWDAAGRVFDAVVAGQAWHWVDPVAGAAKAAQVLRPGGRLAVFWNSFRPPADLDDAFAEVYRRVFDTPFSLATMAGPHAYSAMCAKAAAGMLQAGAFGDADEWRFDWERSYTREEWLEVLPTFGGFSQYPADAQRELLAGIGAAIDAVGGSFTMGYTAVVATAARSGRAA